MRSVTVTVIMAKELHSWRLDLRWCGHGNGRSNCRYIYQSSGWDPGTMGIRVMPYRSIRSHSSVCRLGGVVVSVLSTGPKGRGFEPGQGDGLSRAIKIRSTFAFV
jgi:hypothetical protein